MLLVSWLCRYDNVCLLHDLMRWHYKSRFNNVKSRGLLTKCMPFHLESDLSFEISCLFSNTHIHFPHLSFFLHPGCLWKVQRDQRKVNHPLLPGLWDLSKSVGENEQGMNFVKTWAFSIPAFMSYTVVSGQERDDALCFGKIFFYIFFLPG